MPAWNSQKAFFFRLIFSSVASLISLPLIICISRQKDSIRDNFRQCLVSWQCSHFELFTVFTELLKKFTRLFTGTYIRHGRLSNSVFLPWRFLVVVGNSTRIPVTKIVDREMSLPYQAWLTSWLSEITLLKTFRYILLVVILDFPRFVQNHDTEKSPIPRSWRMRASRYLRSKRLSFTRKVGFIL